MAVIGAAGTDMDGEDSAMVTVDTSYQQGIETAAIIGARNDRSVDKSDWIRIWVMSRKQQGLPHDSDDWKHAYEKGR